MTPPLSLQQQTVESRLRQLQQKLNEELGFRDQRLRFIKNSRRAGPTTWVLNNEQIINTGVFFPSGVVADLAPASNDESILYFGYNEEWQPTQTRGKIEFVSSNLRFVISGIEEMPDLRFRLEWAGTKHDNGTIAYPGSGAAHPHWQFDIDNGWIDPLLNEIEEIEIDLTPETEEIDLDSNTSEANFTQPYSRRISATLAGFHHLHLPARSMWHDTLCTMPDMATPQQHTPENADQIDRWVVSALRYLKSEFKTYM